MQTFNGLKTPTAMLLAGFLVLAGCGKNLDAAPKLGDETVSEEELIANDGTGREPAAEEFTKPAFTESEKAQIQSKYGYLDPKHLVPTGLLKSALAYYEANAGKIANKKYLSVIDFSKRSTKARFWIISMTDGSVWALHVAHGIGSDPTHRGYATSFSNVPGSNKSSLGVYKTAETYYGKHGYSLRLDGMSSTNSNVRKRAIVIHNATYVQEAAVNQGRSNGCPAVSPKVSKTLIDKIKNGSVIYAGLSGVR
jgi:hypothetical protein